MARKHRKRQSDPRAAAERRFKRALAHARRFVVYENQVAAVEHLLPHMEPGITQGEAFAKAILIAVTDVRERRTDPHQAAEAAYEVYCHGL